MSNPLKIVENLTPPWNVTSSKKSQDSSFKEKNIFLAYNEIRTHFNVEIWIYICKM